jgi:hypothetical protein
VNQIPCDDPKHCRCVGTHTCNCGATAVPDCRCFACQYEGCEYIGPDVHVMDTGDDRILCEEHYRYDPATILAHNAGARISRRCQHTGTTVTLYDGIAAELDTAGGRWQTVCEQHGTICSHQRYREARDLLLHPEEWCADCLSAIKAPARIRDAS